MRRTVLRSKGGGRYQIAEVSTVRLRPWESLSVTSAKTRPAGRTTLVSTGMVDGFDGVRLAQHGCCSPQGIAGELIARNRAGEILG